MASILSSKQQQHHHHHQKKKMRKKNCYSTEELKTLGQQLLSSRSHINNLPFLLSFVSPLSPLQHALESILSLHSFFTPLLNDLPPSSKKSSAPLETSNDTLTDTSSYFIYTTWLRSKFDDFVKSLIDISISPQSDNNLKDVALDSIMEFVKLGKEGRFQSAIYHKFLRSVVHSTSSVDFLLDLLASKFFKYADVRYFTYISLEKIARSFEPTNIIDNRSVSLKDADNCQNASASSNIEPSIRKVHDILSSVQSTGDQDRTSDYEMWSQFGFSSKVAERKLSYELLLVEDKPKKSKERDNNASYLTKKMKLKFTKAWVSFLRLRLPLNVYKEVLATLHQTVIPHMANPVILCDFLTRSYDIGGVISVMALSSLFILMTEHGLEYANFYEKLYALLVPAIFMAKHRAKFFQLLDLCLKSSLLPAYLAAAFAKKLSRVALSVPPSGALVIIAIIHNLLRRHPSTNCLVHQQADGKIDGDDLRDEVIENAKETVAGPDISGRKRGVDLFNSAESDPAKSNAMRSSLWEVDTLRHHYCPAVSRFVASLENDLTVRAKTSEVTVKDFSSGSYTTIFREEIGRRIKQVPLAFYQATPTSLFLESDFAGWTFGFKQDTGNNESCEMSLSNGGNHKSAKRQRLECS